jgi:hypothetical protein
MTIVTIMNNVFPITLHAALNYSDDYTCHIYLQSVRMYFGFMGFVCFSL